MSKSYVCGARSNPIRIKTEDLFMQWARQMPGLWVGVEARFPESGQATVTLYMESGELWPEWACDEDATDWREVDFLAELSRYLVKGEVAVLSAAGFEEGSYRLIGESIALNDSGEVLKVQLSDIEAKMREHGWSEPLHPRNDAQ